MYFKTIILLLIIIENIQCSVKEWLPNTDISDQNNWLKKESGDKCKGLIFSDINEDQVFIEHLEVEQLVLPKYGKISFGEKGIIQFGKTDNPLNCVQLKPIITGYLMRPDLWKNLDNSTNSATPDVEQLPCWYDEVSFPHGINTSIFMDYETRAVYKNLFENIMLDKNGLGYFSKTTKILPKRQCEDPAGCVCHNEKHICDYLMASLPKPQCEHPIKVIGNCHKLTCGATILIKNILPSLTVNKIKEKLKNYQSDTHVSKVLSNDDEKIIQIVFAEKKFTGNSLIEAQDFYDSLLEETSLHKGEIELVLSGGSLYELDSQLSNLFSIFFGTMLGAVLVFGILCFVSSQRFRNLNLGNRFSIVTARPAFMSARYRNIEDDTRYNFDGQSVIGSVVSLSRSFDNPLYEDFPSTRSTSNETIATKIDLFLG
ncbi:protein amnionless-like isoform X2 [Sitophilus oryzae]|uniref:Protein amnionless n=1 Tax=Sitophilus oryzae TaxID=7048 RepID=A0A6J2XKJ8_SITOR|nr:protein amnionless-like isoform X2 [Sitophilus oryzae]